MSFLPCLIFYSLTHCFSIWLWLFSRSIKWMSREGSIKSYLTLMTSSICASCSNTDADQGTKVRVVSNTIKTLIAFLFFNYCFALIKFKFKKALLWLWCSILSLQPCPGRCDRWCNVIWLVKGHINKQILQLLHLSTLLHSVIDYSKVGHRDLYFYYKSIYSNSGYLSLVCSSG